MFSIQSTAASRQPECAVNLLPCRVQHTGPANATDKHWTIETNDKGDQVAYFRGRRLIGKDTALPEGYTGAVMEPTDEVVEPAEDADEDEEKAPEVRVLKQVAGFEKITVWGHEVKAEAREDAVLRGVEEWIQFAGKVHGFEEE